MNIRDINLLQLKYMIENCNQLSHDDIDIVNRIIFIADSEKTYPVDIEIVCGNPYSLFDRCDKAIDIWMNHKDAILVLSGGAKLPNKQETESESMKRHCINRGVSFDKILIENKSMTTEENIIYCADVVKKISIISPSIVAVSSKTHMRRVMMNFQKHKLLYPKDSLLHYACSEEQKFGPTTWFSDSIARQAIATEIGFIHEYLYELNYPCFDF